MKLYYAPGACSLACHIVAREAGIALDLERVDFATRRTAGGADYLQLNPKGTVPLLQLDSDELLTEQAVISQYLADLSGDTRLMPAAGTLPRYRVMAWQAYLASDLQRSFAPLFGAPPLDDAAKARFRAVIAAKYEWLDGQLADRAYLTGDVFTAADAHLFAITGWCSFLQVDIARLAHLGRFLGRVAARPAVLQAMQAEGLVPAR